MGCRTGKDESSGAHPRAGDRTDNCVVCCWCSVAGILLSGLAIASAEPPRHYPWTVDMPPDTVGQAQLLRTEPISGYFQPVQIRVPRRARVSLAMDGAFVQPQKSPVTAAMQVGQVYRFQVSNIPLNEGFEVYPTVEVINRLYPPPGEESRFPIPIELTFEDLELALAGKLVTRVIYLEPPDTALPRPTDLKQQRYFDVGARNNPWQIADELGRPMAILRLGGIVPDRDGPTDEFLFGSPPIWLYEMDLSQNHYWEPMQPSVSVGTK